MKTTTTALLLFMAFLWGALSLVANEVYQASSITSIPQWTTTDRTNKATICLFSKHLSEFQLNSDNFNFEYIVCWAESSVWTNKTDDMSVFLDNLYSNNNTISSIDIDWVNRFPSINILLTGYDGFERILEQGIIPYVPKISPPEEEPEIL